MPAPTGCAGLRIGLPVLVASLLRAISPSRASGVALTRDHSFLDCSIGQSRCGCRPLLQQLASHGVPKRAVCACSLGFMELSVHPAAGEPSRYKHSKLKGSRVPVPSPAPLNNFAPVPLTPCRGTVSCARSGDRMVTVGPSLVGRATALGTASARRGGVAPRRQQTGVVGAGNGGGSDRPNPRT